MITFLALAIALAVERFFDWSHLRRWDWYLSLVRQISPKIPPKSPYLTLAALIVPVMLLVLLINYALTGLIFSLIKLIFEVAVLLFCFGPRNLWADSFACENAVSQGDAAAASDKLKNAFNITAANDPNSMHREFLNNIFLAANVRVFALAFWFAILGPMGAVMYRLVTLFTSDDNGADISHSANEIQNYLDWPTARLLSLLFTLGGKYSQVFAIWVKRAFLGPENNNPLLIECGSAALGYQEAIPADGSGEKAAISLLDRSFAIFLVLVLLLEIII